MEAINLASSIASIILAVIAIGMSVYFYTQSKNTETKVESSLESIKAQTDTLQKLTGKWMDRLTKYVTDSNPYDQTFIHIISALKELPTILFRKLVLRIDTLKVS